MSEYERDELFQAVRLGELRTLHQVLKERGVNELAMTRNEHGWTPLRYALLCGQPRVADMLRANGVQV